MERFTAEKSNHPEKREIHSGEHCHFLPGLPSVQRFLRASECCQWYAHIYRLDSSSESPADYEAGLLPQAQKMGKFFACPGTSWRLLESICWVTELRKFFPYDQSVAFLTQCNFSLAM